MNWLDKYKPKIPEDLLISKINYDQIFEWLNNFKNNKSGHNCLYLYGPLGCGKTIIAHTFLNYFKYEIKEKNLSNLTKKKDFNQDINDILHKKNILNMFNKNTKEISIILDEIEGLTNKEVYMFNDLLSIIFSKKKYRYLKYNPFIIISDSLNKKMKPYKSKCLFIEIKMPDFESIENYCKKILENENIVFDKKLVQNIIEKSKFDIRQVIINLEQSFTELNGNNKMITSYKNVELNDYKYIENHFKKYSGYENYSCNINKNFAYMLFYENFIEYILKNKISNKLETIISIYKNFSDSDNLDYLLYKYMKWELIDYNNTYKISRNSYLINNNKQTDTNKNIDLKYSLLLNKNSLEFINLKTINLYLPKIFKNSMSINIYNLGYYLKLLEELKLNNKGIESIETNIFYKIIKFIN